MSKARSTTEVEAVVIDYFEMLRLELDRLEYNKAEHNRDLRLRLNDRSKSSVELKHQNISAILDSMELRFITGYKPKANYQGLLREGVQAYLANHLELKARLRKPTGTNSGGSTSAILLISSLLSVYALCG